MRRLAAVLFTAMALLAGCSPDIKDGVGPIVPIPNVEGVVQRGGAPAAGVTVSLRTDAGVEIDRTSTSSYGHYGFGSVSEGAWEIKASGRMSRDFDSVTRAFQLTSPTLELGMLDIDAHGAAATMPSDGATVPTPDTNQPIMFEWVLPDIPGVKVHVQVFDAASSAVWSSSSVQGTQVSWDGQGNQANHQGPTPAGTYSWRLKFDLPDSSQAKLPARSLIFI